MSNDVYKKETLSVCEYLYIFYNLNFNEKKFLKRIFMKHNYVSLSINVFMILISEYAYTSRLHFI